MTVGRVEGNAAQAQVLNEERPRDAPTLPTLYKQVVENVYWAWDTAWEKLYEFGASLKGIIERIIQVVTDFFAPKIEWIQEKVWGAREPLQVIEPQVITQPVQEDTIKRMEEVPQESQAFVPFPQHIGQGLENQVLDIVGEQIDQFVLKWDEEEQQSAGLLLTPENAQIHDVPADAKAPAGRFWNFVTFNWF